MPIGTTRQSINIRSVAYIGTDGTLALFMLGFASTPKPRAQSNAHHLFHADHYSKWKQPGTDASCCNGKETKDGNVTGDCYPTTAEVRDGHWLTKTDDGQWVVIPYDRILRESNPDIEGAHLCLSYGRVLCFAHRTRAHRRAMNRRRADQPGALTVAMARWTGLLVLATKLDELLLRPDNHWRSQRMNVLFAARGSNGSGATAATLPRTEQSSQLVSVG